MPVDAIAVLDGCLAVVPEIKAPRPGTRVVVLTLRGGEIQAEAAGADRAVDRETFLSAFLRPRASPGVGSGGPFTDRRRSRAMGG